jgi:hypothetical protein
MSKEGGGNLIFCLSEVSDIMLVWLRITNGALENSSIDGKDDAYDPEDI